MRAHKQFMRLQQYMNRRGKQKLNCESDYNEIGLCFISCVVFLLNFYTLHVLYLFFCNNSGNSHQFFAVFPLLKSSSYLPLFEYGQSICKRGDLCLKQLEWGCNTKLQHTAVLFGLYTVLFVYICALIFQISFNRRSIYR